MAVPVELLVEFHSGLSQVGFFLQSILPKESLSAEAEKCRKECITHVEGMNNTINNMKNNNLKEGHLLNTGLSISNQSLNESDDFGLPDDGIPRSESLPDMTKSQSENLESWQTSRTTKQAFHCSNKYGDLDEDMNLNDLRELVIYDPIQEEEEDEEDEDNGHNDLDSDESNEPVVSRSSSKRKSRKRDSAALFDISLGDLTEPDFAGLLTEKHSGKLWLCVLIDQHLCIFPSQDPDEVAYDVIIMPCCQISLDDRLMRTPVFRLTQSGMTPWVFVASNNDELKEWMKALTIAASAGKHDAVQVNSNETHSSHAQMQPLQMQSINEEEEEEEENLEEHQDEQLPVHTSLSLVNCIPVQSSNSSPTSVCEKSEEAVGYVNTETLEINSEGEEPPELPKRPDKIDGEPFGEVVNVQAGREEYEDDGFATDEFESGSSDNGDATPNPQSLPVQQKAKKTKFFHWLKKKAKKDKLFSSPQDGVALAGYGYKSNLNSKRWFLVREGKLHCYKAIKDDDAEITVDLNGSEIKAGEDEKNKLAVQVIRGGALEFTLMARSVKDWERWKKALLIESGFIKLAVSPTERSSGVFEQDDDEEGDYIVPESLPGREKLVSHEKPDVRSYPDSHQSIDVEDDDDLYMEVVPATEQNGNFRPISQSSSSSVQELGPLPPLPPELPPRRTPEGAEKKEVSDSGEDSGDFEEIYEEVSSTVAHADKVVDWGGLTRRSEGAPTEAQNRDVEKGIANKGEEIPKSSKSPVPAGLADGTVEDSAITASSFLDSASKPSAGRLDATAGAWCAKVNDKQQYLQIDLGEITKVCGVASQGRAGLTDEGGWFVKTFTLAHSKNAENWVNYKEFGIAKVFQGNSDPDTAVINMLKMAVNARYIRIKPQAWHNHIALRAEVFKGAASSKLTSGIHKLADSLSKAGKGKSFDKQDAETSPTTNQEVTDTKPAKRPLTRKVSFDDKVKYIDRQASVENLADEDEAEQKEKQADGVQEDESSGEGADYLEIVREASKEEKEVELKVQQKIDERRKQESAQQIGRHEVSQGILAKRNLYEQNRQTGSDTEVKKNTGLRTRKENVQQMRREIVVESRDAEPGKSENGPRAVQRTGRKDSESYNPDKEREDLERTEQAFQDYAKQLKQEGGTIVREKRGSIVALNRLNFEDPAKSSGERSINKAKSESILKEKEELLNKLETLKRRIAVAKDRKIFFTLSTNRSPATADADAEFHESQYELAKTKKRLLEIETETKNLKVLELRYQKTPEKSQAAKKSLVRKHSRECMLGPVELITSKVDASSVCSPAEKEEKEKAHKGSVLSQIKAFEKMKK